MELLRILRGLFTSKVTPSTMERVDLPLVNADFDDGFRNVDGIGELCVAKGWIPWRHRQDTRPEYKRANRQDAPGNRVYSGEYAQQWFNKFAKSTSGIYQVVEGITPGMLLVFKDWMMVWSSVQNDPTKSVNGRLRVRIGIGPYGGTDPELSDIVWSGGGNAIQPYDAWEQLEVETLAKSDRATLWIWSQSEWPTENNNVYVDGCEFYALGQPSPEPSPVPEERVREIVDDEIAKSFEAMAASAQGILTGLEDLMAFLQDMRTEGWTAAEDVTKGR